ncbi:MAG: hypothetical protein R2713_11130 [Ilumatobacteraceae bacterium]
MRSRPAPCGDGDDGLDRGRGVGSSSRPPSASPRPLGPAAGPLGGGGTAAGARRRVHESRARTPLGDARPAARDRSLERSPIVLDWTGARPASGADVPGVDDEAFRLAVAMLDELERTPSTR